MTYRSINGPVLGLRKRSGVGFCPQPIRSGWQLTPPATSTSRFRHNRVVKLAVG